MAAAFGMLRPRGQLLMCAPAAPGRVRPSGEHAGDPLATIAMKELSVVGARGGRLADALRALEREEVDVVSLISRRVPLAEAPAAVRSLAEPGVVSLLVAR
jgi:threonine dehydrogenase-like Zn-dependent dehydrogenase